MSLPIPNIEPSVITAGDTITWSRSLPDYPVSSGWVLKYALRGPTAIDIVGGSVGGNHLITVDNIASALYVEGNYTVQGYVTNGSSRVTVYSGSITIKPDLVTAAAGYDGRSHVKKVLDSIEAVIEGRASRGDQELTIDGTRLVKMTTDDLLKLRLTYFNLYRQETNANRRAAGSGPSRVRQVIPL